MLIELNSILTFNVSVEAFKRASIGKGQLLKMPELLFRLVSKLNSFPGLTSSTANSFLALVFANY